MDHLVAFTGQLMLAASSGLAPKRKKALLTAANRVFVLIKTLLIGVGLAGLAGYAPTLGAQVVVTTLAGTAGVVGSVDGSGGAAQFFNPSGIATDTAGNLYVTDQANHTIRKITAAGVVSTLAGTAGVLGSADGSGATARFYNPLGIARDTAGNLYVVDQASHTIRKITATGVVSTLAGTAGVSGSADGSGVAARFLYPHGITTDAAGNLYLVDRHNHTIRKITAAGVVTTLAGTAGVLGSADGSGAAAQFNDPFDIAADTAGNLYVTDNLTIRKITAAGVVTTLAGTPGVIGTADGSGTTARFGQAVGIAIDTAGSLYVADTGYSTIRKVTVAGVVSTVAGIASGFGGSADGSGAAAQFRRPVGIAANTAGNLYVADTSNLTIRKITQSSVPRIANLSPNSGPVGAPLFIQGSSFGAQQNTSTVSVCGASPAITKWSDTLIALAVPNFPAGTVCNVRVWTSQGEATLAQYTITKLTSVSGRVVNQIGDPLGSVTVLLSGPTSKTITTTSNGQYLVSGIPSGDYIATLYRTGYQFTPSPKTVSVNGVVDVTGVNFVGSAIMPALTKINPDHQKDVALPVILSGTGFGSRTLGSKVLFGGIEAGINSWSDTSIEVIPPFLPASVLVQVITSPASAGKSNYLAFQYPTKNLNVAYSLENPVNGLINGVYPILPIISNVSSTTTTVTKDISVTNPTQAWYVLYVQTSGIVRDVAVQSGGVLIAPGETLSIGRITFGGKSSLRVYVDRDAFHPNSVCRAGVINCDKQALLIQTAQALEMLWRLVSGSPIPVGVARALLPLGLDSLSGLATDTRALLQGDVTAIYSVPQHVAEILASPEVIFALSTHGLLPPILLEAVIMFRVGLVVSALVETLIYPHSGAILFEVK